MRKFFVIVSICCLSFFNQYVLATSQYLDLSDFDPQKKVKISKNEYSDIAPEIIALDLSKNSMTFKDFYDVTEALDPQQFKKIKIIDLSDNALEKEVSVSLEKWLMLKSKPFVKITGNPISLRNIEKLYSSFLQNFEKEEVQGFMGQIIFISRDYVRKAEESVKVYERLKNESVIPSNWATIHKSFYNLPEFKEFLQYKKSKQYQDCLYSMKTLSLSSSKELHEASIEDLEVNFKDALKNITPNYTQTIIE